MRLCTIDATSDSDGAGILFNDGHVLQLRSESIAIYRWMNMTLEDYDCQMIPGDTCGLNFLPCLTVEGKLEKN